MASGLLIIDMQMDMQARLDRGQDRVNGGAGAAIEHLLARFRKAGAPVLHVRHREDDPAGAFHPSAATFQPMPQAREAEGEPVFVKTSSSAFATTDLEDYLRLHGIDHLYVVGAVAGFCVNSTVRSAADLGFRVSVVRDAVLGFDLGGLPAQMIFDVTMGLLAADFATMTDTAAVLNGGLV